VYLVARLIEESVLLCQDLSMMGQQ